MRPILTIIAASIRKIVGAIIPESFPTSDPYLDNVVLSLRMESSDPYYNQVVLGMHMDDTGLTDVKSHTITLNGNVARSATQSKFGGYSAYFDGTGDYLTLTTGSEFNFGTGDFTIECWLYPTTIGTTAKYFLGKVVAWATNLDFSARIGTTGLVTFYAGDNTPIALESDTALSINNWYHLAFVRNSGVTSMYINGIKQSSTHTGSVTIPNDATTLYIGSYTNAGSEMYYGYMDDFRITKGVARYTKNFSIPTAAFPEPTNTAIDDTGKTVTTVGGAQFSGLSKYGSGSFYFDGSGDYLTIPNNSDLYLSSGDFTIEAWIYRNVSGVSHYIFSGRYGLDNSGYEFRVNANNTLQFFFTGGSNIVTTDTVVSASWVHVAFSRVGNQGLIFISGVLAGSLTWSNGVNNTTGTFKIGCAHDTSSSMNGYIDDLRITKGVARYTANFTPYKILTTAPAGDPLYNYTTLLLKMNGTNGGTTFTDNSYSPKTVSRYGSVVTSTSAIKYGSASCYSPGTLGSYLTVPKTTAFDFGSVDFTIELWAYLIALNANTQAIFSTGKTTGSDYYSLRFYVSDLGYLNVSFSNTGTSTQLSLIDPNIFSLSTWQHIAVTRSGNIFTLWKNGVSVASGTMTGSIYYSTADPVCIGTDPAYGGVGYLNNWNGYKDDFRITKGFARYTGAFQPPGPHIAAIDPDTDQWWLNTVLAMRMDGAHGSTTFTDSRGLSSITSLGAVAITSAISKFGQAASFISGGSFNITPVVTLTADFCLEMWVYMPTTTGTITLFGIGNEATGRIAFITRAGVLAYDIYAGGTEPDLGTATVPLNTWTHVAWVRSGSTLTGYINGTASGSTTQTGTLGNSEQMGSCNQTGYCDDLRLTVGVPRYTANFTPPEKPLPTYVIGPDHDPYWDKVVLACPFDTNANDARNHTPTLVGNASIVSTQKMFGTGSAYFDGVGDDIGFATSTDWNLGAIDFCMEAWIYHETTSNTDPHIIYLGNSGGTVEARIKLSSTRTLQGVIYHTSAYKVNISGTTVLATNTWYHVAFVRYGNVHSIYLNGIMEATSTLSHTIPTDTMLCHVGRVPSSTLDTYRFKGYIDDLRITKGVARYTANFEPPIVANILG